MRVATLLLLISIVHVLTKVNGCYKKEIRNVTHGNPLGPSKKGDLPERMLGWEQMLLMFRDPNVSQLK